ncbi:tetratricopeptide repeat protein [Phenylobacterium conjunctum]|uniref:Tetratricopeptide repeat protein n=1 Tax=Phenylobacterium conjunctum TaxID=1298959 RepID=A0ABW3T4W1_9CAUL
MIRATILLAGLLAASAAQAEHPSRTNGKLDVVELCAGVENQTMELEPRNPFIFYSYENELADAAGVFESDSEAVMDGKIGRLLDANMPRLLCNSINFNPNNGNILKLSIARKSDGFIDSALTRWKLNLNQVDEVDGRTVLDYIEARAASEQPRFRPIYDNYAKRFRAAGAKSRTELEAAGSIPPASVVQARILARLEGQARAGDFETSLKLFDLYGFGRSLYGVPVPTDLGRSRSWLEHAAKLANAGGDATRILRVGQAYSNSDLSTAFSWYQRASQLGSADADFYIARAYTWALGAPRDLNQALVYMTRAETQGVPMSDIWMGYINEKLGRREQAIGWYRYAAQTGRRQLPIPSDGGQILLYAWFPANHVEECGMNIKGFDNCRR